MGALLLVGALFVACDGDESGVLADTALSDFGPYTFVEPDAEAESHLVEYMESVTPNGSHLVRVVVRSVRSEEADVAAEAVAATFHLAELDAEQFQTKIGRRLAPGSTPVLEGQGLLVDLEGTAALVSFLEEETLIYLVGKDPAELERLAEGLLNEHGS